MSEGRKTFSMSTFAAYLKGEVSEDQKQAVKELLDHMTQKNVDDEFEPFAAALSKAWIYEQHPDLAKLSTEDVSAMGEKVSVTPLPAGALGEVNDIFDKLADYRNTINTQKSKIEELEAQLAEVTKEKDAKIADLSKKVKDYEAEKSEDAEKMFVTTEARIVEFTEKLQELLKEVEEVKKTGVVVAGAAPAAGGAAPAGGGAPEAGGEPEADFGFGGDPFADSSW